MNENYYNKDAEVNVMDFVFYLLRQWRTLFIAVILGGIVGAGIFMIKRPATESVSLEEESEDLAENYQVDPEVKANMDLAFQYRQLYAQQVKYNQNSLIMSMDPREVYCGELKYYVSAEERTDLICERMLNVLNDEEFLKDLQDEANLDCGEQYLKEVISGTVVHNEEDTINIEAGYTSKNFIISYKAYFSDADTCEKILTVIQNYVRILNQELQEAYGEYLLEPISNTIVLTMNDDFLNRKKSSIDAESSYLNNIIKLEDTFEDDDLEYYEAVYLSRDEAEDEEIEEFAPAVDAPQNPLKELIKWVVASIFLMCVCWGGYYLFKYLFDNHVKSVSELQHRYGLQLLGKVRYSGMPRKGIDGLLERLDRKRKGSSDAPEYVAAVINSLSVQHPLLCLDQTYMDAKKLADILMDECHKLEVSNFIHMDSAALEKAKNKDGVILMVILGYTEERQFCRELEICRMQEIPVLGTVVVE